MAIRLTGGSALRARLANVAAVGPEFAQAWADEAAKRMRETKPHSDRPQSDTFTTKATATRGGVFGAFWWIFVDRGTKAHGPKTKQALRFQIGDETIFTKHVKRQRRRPFISRAAQGALHALGGDLIIKAWNGRRIRGAHRSFL